MLFKRVSVVCLTREEFTPLVRNPIYNMKIEKKKCSVCGKMRITVDESGRCILCRGKFIGPGTEIKQTSNGNRGGTEIRSKTHDYKKENGWMSKF